jgi:hypothetical protein
MKSPLPILQPGTSFASEQAIVSPCSTCTKYQDFDTNENQEVTPPCPRRYWKNEHEAYKKDERDYDPSGHLLETGTKDQNTLKNPVFSRASNSILLWVAKLVNNRPNKSSGNPDILDPGFNTDYIECELLPYIPEETQQSMWSRGVYQEGDLILITPNPRPQLQGILNEPEQLGGSARKVNFHRRFSLEAPAWDKIVSGT